MTYAQSWRVAVLLSVLMVAGARAATVTWTNTSGGLWSAPANWDPHIVPGASDTALITAPGAYTVTVDVDVSIVGLTLGGASGQQTLTNNNRTFSINRTLVALNGIFNAGSGTLAGGPFTNQGTFNWSGGTVAVPVIVAPTGTLNVNGGPLVLQSTLTNNGTVHWSGGSCSLTIYNNHGIYTGGIYNQAGALFDMQNDQGVYSAGFGFESFLNAGTVRKSAGTGTSYINVGFTNSGTVDAQSGTIQLGGGGNIGGAYNTASGAIVQFSSGTFAQTGTVTNTGLGTFRQNGATVVLSDRITKFILASGNVVLSSTFQGSGAIQNLQLDGAFLTGTNRVTGTLGIDGGGVGAASPLTVAATGVLNFNGAAVTLYSPVTNFGTVNWSGASVSLANNNSLYTGAIYNQPGALFNLQSDQTLSSAGYGFELFSNAGSVRKTAGLAISYFSLLFTNAGTVDAQCGTIQFSGGGNIGGTYNTAPTATIQFAGGSFLETAPVTITGSGVCRQNGATVMLADQIANFVLASGYVALSPAFQTDGTIHTLQLRGAYLTGTNRVTGTLGLDGGGLAGSSPLTVAASGVLNLNGAAVTLYSPLTNAGTINWSGGSVSVANNNTLYTGAIYNQLGGTFNLQSDQTLSTSGYGFELLNNAGTIRKTSGLGVSAFSIATTNTGLVEAQSGAIHFVGGGTLSGSYNTAPGTIIEFDSGNYVQAGTMTVTGAGLCRQNGATVTLTDRIPSFVLASGPVVLTPSFQTDGTIHSLQLDGASLTGANRVTGTLGFNGGSLASASPLTITASGVLNFNGAPVAIYSPLTNSGTINWSSGSLSIANNAAAYTGVVYNQPGGFFNLQCDQSFSTSGYGFELFNNAGTIRKTAGLGTSTFSVAFANTGTLDAQSGIIRFTGPYTQTGGTMNFGITSLAYFGQIAFSAVAPLTGTLSVNFNGGYFPSAGDSFALVTYGSRGGIFGPLALPPQAQWQTNYSTTTFTLSVLGAGGPPVTLTPVSYDAGTFTLQINGSVGPSYVLLASTNFSTWIPLNTNTPLVMPFMVADTNAGKLGRRFYRAQVGP